MSESILAWRPGSAVERLAARSQACPLSLRDVLVGLGPHGFRLPVVRAPVAGVARAALLAAGQRGTALALALPEGDPPEPWFEAVTLAADEVAPRLPICLSGELAVAGASPRDLERARDRAWRLVDGGITHLAVDLEALPLRDWASALELVGEPARERELGLDLVLPREKGLPSPPRAADLLEELRAAGLVPDAVSARCPLPGSEAEEGAQERVLADLCAWLEGIPVLRRGPLTPGLLARLGASPVKGCEDGGTVHAAACRAMGVAAPPGAGPSLGRQRVLPPEIGDRPEALAYVEAAGLLEGLCIEGSAREIEEALRQRSEEG